jgi:hypothetical protein
MFINITIFYYFGLHLQCHRLPTTQFVIEPSLLIERFLISHDSWGRNKLTVMQVAHQSRVLEN